MNACFSKISIIVIFFFATTASAQLKNEIFHQRDSLYQGDTQTVRLHFESLIYLRNTEYFDIIEDGQTYFGNLLQLHASYQPYRNVIIKAGVQTRQDYGSNKLLSVNPVFSVSIFKHKWRHNFGMLQATTNLGLIEPMFNIDRAITNRIENGIQSIYKNGHTNFTNWLVWTEPTYRYASNQEQFNTGFVWNKNILTNKNWSLIFPLQGTLVHRGGQINETSTPIYSRMNVATGAKLGLQLTHDFSMRTEHYWLHSEDFSPTITQPYKNGNASWHTLSFQYRKTELMFNYWAGREWQTPIGTQIYNNFNFYDIYKYRQVRHMLMGRLLYFTKVKENLMLDLRLEPFYDFEYKFFQYSYSVYLRWNFTKALGKI